MLIHWIWFARLPKLQPVQKMALLAHFRDPEEIYFAGPKALRDMEGMAEALENKDLTEAEGILRRCTEKNICILTFADEAYPARLKNIYDPPLVLYYMGRLPDWERQPVIGIVGTRKASAYGLQMGKLLGGQISAGGGLVISGGADGIDAMAMTGALEAGCTTVSIMAGGLDSLYPKCNRQLFARTLEHGCLISEYPPGTPSYRWNFPARNRIISGISNGVLVVEAPAVSGALITAGQAKEQGRDVFVVPANADVPTSVGSNGLLREGAIPVWNGRDILKEYEPLYPQLRHRAKQREFTPAKVAQTPLIPENVPNEPQKVTKKTIDKGKNSTYSDLDNRMAALDPQEKALLGCLTRQPEPVDAVIARAQMPAAKVLSMLTKLSLKGLVKNHPGKRVSLF